MSLGSKSRQKADLYRRLNIRRREHLFQKGSNQSPIGQITGLGDAGPLVVAKKRDLYVAAGNLLPTPAIYVYHRGQQEPYTTLTPGGFGLALDSKGNLYATQFGNVINVYAAGSTTPTSTLSG